MVGIILNVFSRSTRGNTSKGFENDDLHIKGQKQTNFGKNILKVTATRATNLLVYQTNYRHLRLILI